MQYLSLVGLTLLLACGVYAEPQGKQVWLLALAIDPHLASTLLTGHQAQILALEASMMLPETTLSRR